MHSSYVITTILAMATVMFALRAIPFFLPKKVLENDHIKYIGKYLPAAIMLLLVMYCQKDLVSVNTSTAVSLITVVAIAVVAFMHWWKSNMMLSIMSGTVFYMLLLQVQSKLILIA